MVRKLEKNEQKKAFDFVVKEPEFNLFMIGNLEKFSLEEDFLDVWVEEEDGKIIALLNRYFQSFIFYAIKDYNVDDFIDILKEYNYSVISGKKDIMNKFYEKLDNTEIDEEFFCILKDLKKMSFTEKNVEDFSINDFDSLIELRNNISEFKNTNYDHHKNKFISKTGRAKVIKEDKKIVSIAETSAENSKSAMITGVATYPKFRGKGYASKLVYELCSELIKEDISPCLFFDNPSAGNIYKKLGFQEIGKYLLIFNDNK